MPLGRHNPQCVGRLPSCLLVSPGECSYLWRCVSETRSTLIIYPFEGFHRHVDAYLKLYAPVLSLSDKIVSFLYSLSPVGWSGVGGTYVCLAHSSIQSSRYTVWHLAELRKYLLSG